MSRVFGDTRQLGLVVKNIDDGMLAVAERLGIGPFFIVREVRPTWFRYRGADSSPPLLSLAFAFSGPLQLEIIQQHDDAPSAYREFLSKGHQGAQHLSSWVASHSEYDAAHATASKFAGVPIHEGQIGHARFAYFDTVDSTIGLAYEISESLLAPSVPLWEKVATAAHNWDGQNPIRNLK